MEFADHIDFENPDVVYTRVTSKFEVDGIVYQPPMSSHQHHRWCPIFNFRGDVETSGTVGWRWFPERNFKYGDSFSVSE